ncbi:phage shock protein operon transcriptional activator [Luteithermobacter gelatinilyticus]|uniref:phage shock protein operon transcriptional activator n=1 Tax=Luteithermobacter gelatinilyticus TaxID=2582913 RepID=UPI001106D826|nr:phage shock protein operon transcriptional activator [Luteithermobacter gelatinilyticus]|tara:strand:- start:3479 stop:4552 length:1074 start_codon:yes stop_codon:yes gene_type:complete
MIISSPQDQNIIGESPAFLEVLDQVSRAARHDRPVLVIGERGTGKELIAARLHFLSPRWEKNFLQVNCAALTESLLDSELFGHEAGAFTGAATRRIGRFEEAHEGTLFLDEIATISPAAQEKILRITEYGSFQRVGGNKVLQVDVRLIGATNVDLPAAAEAGRFRHDLLDRLALDVITLPPLRARREDILLLAFHFGQRVARECGWSSFPGFSENMIEAMMEYDWPGNIRELRNVVERAVYHAEDETEPVHHMVLDPFQSPWRPDSNGRARRREGSQPTTAPNDLTSPVTAASPSRRPASSPPPLGPTDYYETLSRVEKDLLEQALKANKHNQRDTAVYLNLTYHQLRHQLKKHNLL